MPDAFWIHDIDPFFFKIDSLEIRYYGLLFAAAMLQGAYFWIRQVVRSGRQVSDALPAVWMVILGVIIGGRIGHVLFYRFEEFLGDPLLPITLGGSGFASHGSALGVLAGLWIYSKCYKMPTIETLDRCALSVPLGTSLVRLGNFFNSEIVGLPTELPWAVIFSRYDAMAGLPPTPRHPSQLYEAAIGIAVFLVLYRADRKKGEARSTGLLTGLLLVTYFPLRFCMEFFKTHHVMDPGALLSMGQILSVPFAVCGLVILIRGRKSGFQD